MGNTPYKTLYRTHNGKFKKSLPVDGSIVVKAFVATSSSGSYERDPWEQACIYQVFIIELGYIGGDSQLQSIFLAYLSSLCSTDKKHLSRLHLKFATLMQSNSHSGNTFRWLYVTQTCFSYLKIKCKFFFFIP